jgi:hypothetical protein
MAIHQITALLQAYLDQVEYLNTYQSSHNRLQANHTLSMWRLLPAVLQHRLASAGFQLNPNPYHIPCSARHLPTSLAPLYMAAALQPSLLHLPHQSTALHNQHPVYQEDNLAPYHRELESKANSPSSPIGHPATSSARNSAPSTSSKVPSNPGKPLVAKSNSRPPAQTAA